MQVFISSEAQKQYLRFPKKDRKRIKQKLLSLELNCFLGKKLGGEYSGFWSLRVWPYRIIYTIHQKQKMILVKSILHRQGVYK